MNTSFSKYNLSCIFNDIVFSFKILFLCCFMMLSVDSIAMHRNHGSANDSIIPVVEQPSAVRNYQDKDLEVKAPIYSGNSVKLISVALSACSLWRQGIDLLADCFKCKLFVNSHLKDRFGYCGLNEKIKEKSILPVPINKTYEKKGTVNDLFAIYSVNADRESISEFRFADSVDDYINSSSNLNVRVNDLNKHFFNEVDMMCDAFLIYRNSSDDVGYRSEIVRNELIMEGNDGTWCYPEGIPFGVKSEFNVKGFKTDAGLKQKQGIPICRTSCPAVVEMEKLNPCIWKLWQEPLGFGVIGINSDHIPMKHPFKYKSEKFYYLGGSSTGAALAQCHGLIPWALNSDGGGSSRIPFASCGLPALKVTWGKVLLGNAYDRSSELVSAGLSANCIKDIMRLYGIVTNTVPSNYIVELRKQLLSDDINSSEIKVQSSESAKIKVLVLDYWIDSAEKPVKLLCNEAVSYLKENSLIEVASLDDIFPKGPDIGKWMNDFKTQFLVHIALFGRDEVTSSLYDQSMKELLSCTSISSELSIKLNMSSIISEDAEIIRIAENYKKCIKNVIDIIFANADIIVCPSLPSTAEVIPEIYWSGVLDAQLSERIMRYMVLPNITGIPAMTVPIGLGDGLPVGLQLMGREGSEYLVSILGELVEKKFGRMSIPKETPMRKSIKKTE